MYIFRYVAVVLFLQLTLTVFTQQITISGTITDSNSGVPVSGASISIEGSNISTNSNSNGRFQLFYELKGNDVLLVTHISYEVKRISLKTENVSTPLNIRLNESTLYLTEVEIMDSYIKSAPFTIEKISTEDLSNTNISDIGSLISSEPNIGGIRKGNTGIDPVIRGFKYSQIVVQIDDGTKIEGGCPNRMDPAASHVNINDLSNISIYKGPFALKYGPGFGGLVILETNKPSFNEKYDNNISMIIGGQTNHTGYRSGIRVNGGNRSISYNFSANKNSYGDYKSGNGDTFKAHSDHYNVTGSISGRISDGHVVTLSTDRSWGRNIDFPTLPMDERSDDTQIYRLNYLGNFGSGCINFVKLSAYHSIVAHEMDNKNRPFSDTVVAISSINASNTGGRMAVNMKALKGKLEIGTSYEKIQKDGNRYKNMIMQPGIPVKTESLWDDAIISNLGLYAEYFKKSTTITWIAALRADYNSAHSGPMIRLKNNGDIFYENTDTQSDHFNLSFSAGMTWHIHPKADIEISIGKGTRSPDMTERFIILLPVGYDPYDYLGNPELLPETNHEIDLGFIRTCERSGRFSASIFFSYVTNFISAKIVPPSILPPQTKGVLGVKEFINIEKAYLTGFEIKHETPEINKWQFRFNAAYTMGMNPKATKIIYENGNASDEITINNDPLPEIPPFEANIWFKYKFFKNKIIPEINFRIVANQNKVSEAYYEEKTPGFNIINFRLVYYYNPNLNVIFGVNNLLNTNYYQHLNRRIIGSKTPFFEPGRIFYTNLIIKL